MIRVSHVQRDAPCGFARILAPMFKINRVVVLLAPLALTSTLHAQTPGSARPPAELPLGEGRDTTQKVCGSTCHRPEMLMGSGRTRDQWTAVVNSMVARGAKATQPELVQILTYLSTNFGPNYTPITP